MSSYRTVARYYNESMDAETRGALRKLLLAERIAHLATLRGGAPMASMTLFLAAPDFSAFRVHVSRLAWHTQDMLQDGRVALSISQTDDARADPFTLMRVTIRGNASQDQETSSLKDAWLSRFPEQAINFTLADFSFWKIVPRDARFIAGFGRIHNLSAAELAQAA
jgi:putative heme iron utilization protein